MCSPRRPRRCTRARGTRSPAFINAPSRDEVIFTKNASESLNLVANMLGWADEPYRVDHETEIVITEMEHLTPTSCRGSWLSQRTGAKLKWFGLTDDGRLDLSKFIDEIITEKIEDRLLVLVPPNILGTVNPVEKIVRRAQEVGALVPIDAASQAAPHMPAGSSRRLHGRLPVAFTGHMPRCAARRVSVCRGGRQELPWRTCPRSLGGRRR
ncbi:aminotransferase class V-fold PLP-dependent enzyme [Streptomyces sp. L7]